MSHLLWLTYLLGIGLLFNINCIAQRDECIFADKDGSGYSLDIRALAGANILGTDNEYEYNYTPCRNGDECQNATGTDTGMAVQRKDSDNECFILANWDYGDVEPSYDTNEQVWKFEYQNGNLCQGASRVFYVYFRCDEESGDYTVSSAGLLFICLRICVFHLDLNYILYIVIIVWLIY